MRIEARISATSSGGGGYLGLGSEVQGTDIQGKRVFMWAGLHGEGARVRRGSRRGRVRVMHGWVGARKKLTGGSHLSLGGEGELGHECRWAAWRERVGGIGEARWAVWACRRLLSSERREGKEMGLAH